MKIDNINHTETLNIRHSVLWPNKPLEFCKLEDDHKGFHYGGFVKGKLVCVASVFIKENSARLRKFATLTQYQNLGYGSKMIKHIITELEESEIEVFWCDARAKKQEFYNRFNLISKGKVFFKSDVEYIVMERKLKSSL